MLRKTTRKQEGKKNEKDFTTSITVDRSPKEVFDAVNDVRAWWSGDIEGSTDKLGAEFKYKYQDFHRSTQKITELVPGKKVVWHIKDSSLTFLKDKTEWNGTDIVFDIAKKEGKTELRFTHVGLVPGLECYEDCAEAWSSYIKDSLKNLIKTKKGMPNEKEKGARKKAA